MGIKEGIWVGENQVGIVFKKGKKEILVPGREVLSVTGGVKSFKERFHTKTKIYINLS